MGQVLKKSREGSKMPNDDSTGQNRRTGVGQPVANGLGGSGII